MLNGFVDLGLITEDEKDARQSAAGGSDVAKPEKPEKPKKNK
jgi:hypothetical protein